MSNPLFSIDSKRGRNNLSIGSLAEIKFIITSVVVPQSTSKFAALIKNANDSATFNTSLENKPIGAKIDLNKTHQGYMSAVDSNSDIINIHNANMANNNKHISGEDHSAESMEIPANTSYDSYLNLKECVTSSTPVKDMSETNQPETYKLNLHTPPEDTSFIDSDIESMDPDEYNTPLANDVCNVSDNETLKCAGQTECSTVNNIGNLTPEEFSFKKPYQSTLRRHKKSLKETPVLKFFTNRRRKKSRLSYDKASAECKIIRSCCDSDSSRSTSPMSRYSELGCTPLLVAENVNRIYNNTAWGYDFDFSYVCEPSTSDLENDDANDANMDTSFDSLNLSTCKFKPACVPTFRLTPPDDLSENLVARKASVLNKSGDMCYESFVEAVVRLEGTTSHCASVRNLDTLSVSF